MACALALLAGSFLHGTGAHAGGQLNGGGEAGTGAAAVKRSSTDLAATVPSLNGNDVYSESRGEATTYRSANVECRRCVVALPACAASGIVVAPVSD